MKEKANGSEALRKVRKNLRKSLKEDSSQEELEFLYKFLSDPRLRGAIANFDSLEHRTVSSEKSDDSLVDCVQSALSDLYAAADENDEAMQLCELLSSPHMRALQEAFDDIAQKRFYPVIPLPPAHTVTEEAVGTLASSPGDVYDASGKRENGAPPQETNTLGPFPPGANQFDPNIHNMIGIKKTPGQDLGITVTISEVVRADDPGDYEEVIVVERVMAGSTIAKRGLLHPGDIILEVDGVRVDSPETLQRLFRTSKNDVVTFKVTRTERNTTQGTSLFVRAHFSYNPDNDSLIPCHEAGLRFLAGDILQIVNQEDPHWWQARKFGSDNRAGLIPSVTLQERRKAFDQSAPDPDDVHYKVFGCGLRRKKKVKMVYTARVAEEFEKTDLVIYEEVARIPAFPRKVICLLGAKGVGRSTLKERLLRSNPDRYRRVIPHTSRPRKSHEQDGVNYFFASRAEMEMDIVGQQYLEYGEHNDSLYGTKIDTVRSISNAGYTCILDCSPAAVKILRTPEFMPYVVFVAAPSADCMKAMYEYGHSMGFTHKWKQDDEFRASVQSSIDLERNYRHLFDFILINDNLDIAFERLEQHLDDLLRNQQWVPVTWLY